ncbi:nuclear distribution protein nudE homolog 1 isoform X5 [Athalia rosae]|uniref:nuclear distribution protein nudE homolog 1 isoform X5 n=1 Tax=Athalia rosae TaxID=37344 RepID=UPI002033AF96|nr:nuclear distribution protein nudE homolog 1 isoform X5 [Athalia rosae]
MMEIDPPHFSNKDEEIQYWMELANQLHQRKEDTERELEEFQENSQMLEKELETSLEQSEKANRELRQRNTRLATEIEQLRTRLDQQTIDCAAFQAQAHDLQGRQDQLVKYIRELEQKNDDLERAQRVNMVTEEEMEAKCNLAIERNALLESELDEKEGLKVMVQRLMDEIRVGNGVIGAMIGNNNNNNNINPPLTPCTRILAMNMIGDLMRKVGLDRWVCMDCKRIKCSCPGGKKTNSTPPAAKPSVQVQTPAECNQQQPRPAKC